MADHKQTLQNLFEEIFNKGNFDAANKYWAPTHIDHSAPNGTPPGLEGVTAFFRSFREAFPDARWTLDDVVAEGDKATCRSTITGTHNGKYWGIPATGRRVTITSIDILRFEGDRIAEHWGQWTLPQELGATPVLTPTHTTQRVQH
jgi:predicted ester cyclase